MRNTRALLLLVMAAAMPGLFAMPCHASFPVSGKGVIEGQVWLPDGKPAVGATVHCKLFGMRLAKEWVPDLVRQVKTGADGAYRVDVLDEGVYVMRVELPGYAPALSELVRPGEPTDFYLNKGQLLKGRVTAAHTYAPLFRARVYLVYELQRLGPIETDRNGEFRLPHAPLGLTKRVSIDGFPIGWTNRFVEHVELRADQAVTVNVALNRGGAVAGRVTNVLSGKPAPGVKLRLAGPNGEEQVLRTDADGNYRLEALTEGVVHAYSEDKRLALSGAEDPRAWVKPGGTSVLDLTVVPRLRVSGIVKNRRGEPIPNAQVDFTHHFFNDYVNRGRVPFPNPLPGYVSLFTVSSQTGPDGTFTADHLTPGPYQAVAWARGYLLGTSKRFFLTPRRPAEGIEVVLDDGYKLVGTVSDPQGQPIPGAKVHVRPLGQEGSFRLDPASDDIIVYADQQGRYVAAAFDPEKKQLIVRASAPGFLLEASLLQAADEGGAVTHDFVLKKAPVITGRILDTRGQPIRRVAVDVTTAPTGRSYAKTTVMTDDDGRFRAVVASAPPATVRMRHPFYHWEETKDVKAGHHIDLVMRRYGMIVGEFINYPKDYAPSIMVNAKMLDGDYRHSPVNFPAGAVQFRVPKLYPGTYSVSAIDHEGKYRAEATGIVVKEGGTTTGVKLYFKLLH